MKLPNVELAVVPEAKITQYLLSLTNSRGRGKAIFFMRYGFTLAAWEKLAAALLKHALENDVITVETTDFGINYIIEGNFEAADGRAPLLRSIWFIDNGQEIPRLTSAYPLEKKGNPDDPRT